jgi:hypothetical protein
VGTLSVELHPSDPANSEIRHREQRIDFVFSVGDRR